MHAVVNASDGGFVAMNTGTRMPLAHTNVALSQVMVVGPVAIVVMHGPMAPELIVLCERAALTVASMVAVVLIKGV